MQMAVAVRHNTNDTRLALEEKVAQAAAQKLPSKKITIMLPILQEYLNIADECKLPELWHQWANCKKKQEFSVLTENLHGMPKPMAHKPFQVLHPLLRLN
jgi:hypothetical protein